MTHSHERLPGVLTHTHGGSTHTHVSLPLPDGPAPALHLSGVVLPEGEQREIWIHDGVISYEPVPDAVTVAEGVWIMPGYVDAHCHIGMPVEGQPMPDEAEMVRQATADRDGGTLLARDLGVPVDNRFLDDREDLPKVIHCGRHIARPKRYLRDIAAEVEPEQLVAEVEHQARRGDGWVKLVGDWIDRGEGDLAPLWTVEQLRPAVERAHELGVKVTAHTFGEEAVAQLVEAGLDGIEHGTGLTDDVIEAMAERQVALVPTLINIENFPSIAAAGEAKFPRYAAHMRELYARHRQTIGKAIEAGVPVYAGTDAGGSVAHGRITDEIAAIAELAGNEYALGAGSWAARQWLGEQGIADGAPADLVVLGADPRVHLGAAREPLLIILRGHVVKH